VSIKAAHPLPQNEQPRLTVRLFDFYARAQALLSTTLALIVLAGGAADAAAA
jgi:hypothetical protein